MAYKDERDGDEAPLANALFCDHGIRESGIWYAGGRVGTRNKLKQNPIVLLLRAKAEKTNEGEVLVKFWCIGGIFSERQRKGRI